MVYNIPARRIILVHDMSFQDTSVHDVPAQNLPVHNTPATNIPLHDTATQNLKTEIEYAGYQVHFLKPPFFHPGGGGRTYK